MDELDKIFAKSTGRFKRRLDVIERRYFRRMNSAQGRSRSDRLRETLEAAEAEIRGGHHAPGPRKPGLDDETD